VRSYKYNELSKGKCYVTFLLVPSVDERRGGGRRRRRREARRR
jgi:hypothetical protein